jgi:hypothetical protein
MKQRDFLADPAWSPVTQRFLAKEVGDCVQSTVCQYHKKVQEMLKDFKLIPALSALGPVIKSSNPIPIPAPPRASAVAPLPAPLAKPATKKRSSTVTYSPIPVSAAGDLMVSQEKWLSLVPFAAKPLFVN